MIIGNGLYGHMLRNALKTAVLLMGFAALLSVLWFVFCTLHVMIFRGFAVLADVSTWALYVDNIVWPAARKALETGYIPLLATFAWSVVSFLYHARMVRALTRARPADRKRYAQLYQSVETLSMAAGLPMPRVEVMRTPALNAYAAGLGTDDAVVAVTQGLLDTLDRAELEAVIAHELAHIKNGDVRLMMVATIIAGGLTMPAELVRSAWSHGADAEVLAQGGRLISDGVVAVVSEVDDWRVVIAYAAVVIVTAGVAITLMFMVRLLAAMTSMTLSRTREFLADAGAADLTKDPDALIRALRKISGHDAMPHVPERLRAMMISSGIDGLFATHPPIADRVAALVAYAGGIEGTVPQRSPWGRARSAGRVLAETTVRAAFGRRRAARV
jgi:heat shock protein HtpX